MTGMRAVYVCLVYKKKKTEKTTLLTEITLSVERYLGKLKI